MDKTQVANLGVTLSESSDDLWIDDFDLVSMAEADRALRESYRVVRDRGVVAFSVLDFGWLIKSYYDRGGGTNQEMADLVFGQPRKALWDEVTIVQSLLGAGYYKAWTGHVPELPSHILLVKAIKLVTS